jgi:hypothetical protein
MRRAGYPQSPTDTPKANDAGFTVTARSHHFPEHNRFARCSFLADRKTCDAIIRKLEVIGEPPPEFRPAFVSAFPPFHGDRLTRPAIA